MLFSSPRIKFPFLPTSTPNICKRNNHKNMCAKTFWWASNSSSSSFSSLMIIFRTLIHSIEMNCVSRKNAKFNLVRHQNPHIHNIFISLNIIWQRNKFYVTIEISNKIQWKKKFFFDPNIVCYIFIRMPY